MASATLRNGISKIQQELGVSEDFPPAVEAAAQAAAANPRLPDLDRTDLPFVTIDPASSMDLDQALHLERSGDGYTVRYAIADVAAFVEPGDPVDVEAHQRGESLYGADSKIPLHPKVLSEGAASLLPDQVRPALLWTIALDATGDGTSVHVERARVRSVAKLSYDGVQEMFDTDSFDGPYADSLRLLKEIGEKRQALEVARSGVNLPLPDQEIAIKGDQWRLEYRSLLPVEDWNAQLSLLTGFGAASLMVYAEIGVLRTLPPPDPRDIKRLHRTARALGLDWPAEQLYPDFIRTLDPTDPKQAAMVVACTRLLRGSGYAAFDGALPAQTEHSALASEYAHVTAPLRRLVDRYAGEVCVALCADQPVPEWVRTALPALPDTMRESGRRAGAYEGAILDLVEAGVLAPHVGETFPGVIVELDDRDEGRGTVTIQEPAVEAHVKGQSPLPLGTDVTVTLTEADVEARKVAFELR
ncbi:RNB domain-containing ribonuclease [Nocardioides panacihumi]|uniref:RNB domain-containing ribonuclease n=1 Tax=Nocardioides panacihumi TaxID=400774 RepID=A0ABP5D9Q0_9ACTN